MDLQKFFLAIIVCTLMVTLTARAQTTPDTVSLETIINKTIKLENGHPIEKAYLHTDKPYYSVGDTIWFKAYVTIEKHVLSPLSRIVYIDVISGKDSLVASIKLPLLNGVAWGDIPLPAPIYKQGNYHLVAYTNWMRNFDPAYFFNKTFSIGNAVDKELVTTVSLETVTKNNQSKVMAHISYRDQNGLPYAGKKLSWTVETEDGKEIKGREITNASGVVNIVVPAANLASISGSPLVTAIDVNPRKTLGASFSLKSVTKEKDLQFFPEGGELVVGLRSVVAFKAININGLGMDVSGTVTDNEGKLAAEFKSQNLGMGKFIMVPEAGKSYIADVTFADGSKAKYDLPRIDQSGISLAVSLVDPLNVLIKIQANDPFFAKYQGKKFYIVAQSGGFIYYAAKSTLSSQLFTAPVLKSKFPAGILQITLFAENGSPVSERIVFIHNPDNILNLSLAPASKTFGARQKVTMAVTSKSKALPVAANLSVAVIDETKVPFDENTESTILTSVLLTSDLKGYIEKPNHYFAGTDEKTLSDLDVLMLTQGYRRFSYRDIIADKIPPVYFLPEQGMELTGTLRDKTGLPIRKGSVSLSIPDKNYSKQTVTDPVGVFKFGNLYLSDSTSVTLSARDNVNANNLMLSVDSPPLQGVTPNFNVPDEVMNIDSVLHPYLQNSLKQYNNLHVLKEVVIKEAAYVKKVNHSDFSALTGLNMEADHTIDGSRFQGCPDFASCLQTMVFGLTYDNFNFYVTRDYNAGKKTPVSIYYNGLNVDYNYLSSINAAEVESVEIFVNDGLSGINRMNQTNGVLVINGKKKPVGKKMTADQIRTLFPPKYLLTVTPIGYTRMRDFYSPKYTTPETAKSNGNDLRSTIYWNPRLVTDKTTGAANIEFYNADTKGNYRAVVEGIDADGNIGRFIYRYTVQ